MKKLDDKKANPKVSKMSATDTYNLYKSTASPAERKEFEKIEEGAKPAKERKAYKAKIKSHGYEVDHHK